MQIYIKNMVCNRCIRAVEEVFNLMNIPFLQIRLGEVQTTHTLEPAQLIQLQHLLRDQGFELLDDQRHQLIARIKAAIVEHVHQQEEIAPLNLSDWLPGILHRDYSALSRLFSETEGRTIEQFLIEQKIERAKELLVYNQLNISEIAWKLGYSSVAHLSSQFKKVTGLTPSHFRQTGQERRKALDSI